MALRHRLASLLFAAALMLSTPGCLCLGGKTYIDDKTDTHRVDDLEARVQRLEQANSQRPPGAAPPAVLSPPAVLPPPAISPPAGPPGP